MMANMTGRRMAILVLAVALPLAMLVLRMNLSVTFGERPLLILFMPAIILPALLGGLVPGLVATGMAAACAAWQAPPAGSFAIGAGHDLFQWGILVASGVLVSLMSTALHGTREALQQSETTLKATVEHAPIGIALVEPNGRCLLANRTIADMFGYSTTEMSSQTWQGVTHPEEIDTDLELVHQLLAGEINDYTREKRFIAKDGHVFWAKLGVTLIRKPNGEPDYFISVVDDITARKEAEAALGESEATYRSLFDHMLNGFAYCRMLFDDGRPSDFVFVEVNNAFESLTGLSQVVGRKVTEVIPGIREASPEMFDIYGRVARGGAPERFETYVEGLRRWFSVSTWCPKPEHFVTVFEVITERKQAEQNQAAALEQQRQAFRATLNLMEDAQAARLRAEQAAAALRTSEARYRSVVNNVKEIIFQTDAQGLWTFLNPAWTEITGFAVADSLGKLFLDYVHPDDRQRNLELFEPLIQRKKDYCRHEIRYLHQNGGFRWIEVFARLTLDSAGNTVGTSGTLADVTVRRNGEEELKRRNDELERFNRATIGRELDMLEMKKTINALSKELGREPPYPLAFLGDGETEDQA